MFPALDPAFSPQGTTSHASADARLLVGRHPVLHQCGEARGLRAMPFLGHVCFQKLLLLEKDADALVWAARCRHRGCRTWTRRGATALPHLQAHGGRLRPDATVRRHGHRPRSRFSRRRSGRRGPSRGRPGGRPAG